MKSTKVQNFYLLNSVGRHIFVFPEKLSQNSPKQPKINQLRPFMAQKQLGQPPKRVGEHETRGSGSRKFWIIEDFQGLGAFWSYLKMNSDFLTFLNPPSVPFPLPGSLEWGPYVFEVQPSSSFFGGDLPGKRLNTYEILFQKLIF